MDTSWTVQLTNQTVEAVEQGEPLPCVIRLSGGYRVQIQSLWRLLSDQVLVLTSLDDGQVFGHSSPVRAVPELAAHLLGRRVSAVQVGRGTGDLTCVFGSAELQIISDSSGYEAWQVEGPEGPIAVGQGGGQVTVWD